MTLKVEKAAIMFPTRLSTQYLPAWINSLTVALKILYREKIERRKAKTRP